MTDWPNVRLEKICLKITDGSHNPPKETPDGPFLMLSSKNVLDDMITLDSPRLLSDHDFAAEDRRTRVQTGDVLLTIVGTVGRAAVVSTALPRFTLQRSVAVLRPDPETTDPRFLMYALQLSAPLLNAQAQGVAQKGIYLNALKDLRFPLPPLDEQKRIVTVLDETFAGIATATANAKKNLANARALFDSFLKSVFGTEAEGWQSKTLAQTCKMYQPKTISAKEMVSDGPYQVFGANGIIGRYDKFNHAEPQLLITCRGATCGSVNVSLANSWITGNAMVVRPLNESIDLKFLEFYFRGGIDISKAITGAAQPQITRTNLETLEIHFPKDAFEQRRIAKVATDLLEAVERLELLIDDKLAALTELKQSLLHKAFAGELS